MNQSATIDWYTRRNELRAEMVFGTRDGAVKLDRTVPGDGTRWYVADWDDWNGGWSHMDSTIEPGDLLGEPMTEEEHLTKVMEDIDRQASVAEQLGDLLEVARANDRRDRYSRLFETGCRP